MRAKLLEAGKGLRRGPLARGPPPHQERWTLRSPPGRCIHGRLAHHEDVVTGLARARGHGSANLQFRLGEEEKPFVKVEEAVRLSRSETK